MVLDQKIATRQSYGEALAELGEENKNVVVLEQIYLEQQKHQFLQRNSLKDFFDMGIAEQGYDGNWIRIKYFWKNSIC